MARWQPPIPAGALYSEPALKLGPALALLAWCYDRVERGGVLRFHLAAAASDIGRPYGTIRDWWRLMRAQGFFAEQIDNGRNGWTVTFHPDWLDWRIMTQNYPDPVNADMSALSDSRDVSVETKDDAQNELNAGSTLGHSRDVSVDASAYKVLHDDHDHDLSRVASNPATPPSEPPNGTPRDSIRRRSKPDRPVTPSEIRQTIADVCSIDLDGGTATRGQVLSLNVEAGRVWKAAQSQGKSVDECVGAIRYVGGWIRKTVYPYSNGQPIKPAAILERWRAAMDARPQPASNGHIPTDEPFDYSSLPSPYAGRVSRKEQKP